jgi:carbon monoxide dehydrogenase subunit G
MASIRREISVAAPAAQVWDAVRDVGAVHQRLVRGVLLDTRMEPGARTVTFANGMVVRELMIDVNPQERRVAWSAVGGRLTHHNASAQVFAQGAGQCRIVWIADLLPHEMAPAIAGMIEQGLAAMKRALGGTGTSTGSVRTDMG